MREVAILGAGGHTRSSVNLLKSCILDRFFKVYDETYQPECNETIAGMPLVGLPEQIPQSAEVFLSIGDNLKRSQGFDAYHSQLISACLIHPQAYLEETISFGIANQIFANVYINNAVNIGDNNIINTSAIIEHEVTLGSHNHLAVGAKVCGRVKVGSYCFVGCGAILIDGIRICDHVIIGAGAVVVEDIVEPGTYVGVPARKIK